MVLVAEDKITVREFLDMDFEDGYLYELINGEIMKHASPSIRHQEISLRLSGIFYLYNKEKKAGRFFAAPCDVLFDEENLALPDLLFVSNGRAHIVGSNRIEGAPDLIVEILSPGNWKTDRGDKMKIYERFGVAEYWLVDPRSQSIEVYVLRDGDYDLTWAAAESGEIESQVLPGFKLDIQQVFGE